MVPSPAPAAPARLGRQLLDVGRLPPSQFLTVVITAAAAIAIGIGLWIWSSAPDYRVLFSNVNDRDGGAILAALGQMNVPYKLAEGGGAIMVPAPLVHETRLKLASQGLPKGGNVGFELVDNQRFGTTQFQEQVNYQRGLEGELARSIQALSAVEAARVHLAIPKPSVFVRDSQQPTASVLLTMRSGRTLDPSQIAGIVHLVASSVPELSPANVSIIGEDGSLLSRRRDTGDGLDPAQLGYVKQIEQATNQRIVDIIEPIVGRDNVRVQVTADVDFNRVEAVAESYKPNQDAKVAALRTSHVSEATTTGAAGPQGVPGALSNQPPAAGVAPIDGRAATATTTPPAVPTSSRKDATTNYEVDKTIQHTTTTVGTVKRMTAAIVVNQRRTVDAAGKVAYAALPQAEIDQITALAREAMGYSKDRGDSLNVVNAAFSEGEKLPASVELPMWKQPDNLALARDIGRYALFGGIAIYLFFGVLRPMLKQASARVQAAPALASSSSAAPAQLAAPGAESADALERARGLARQDPKVVASVVKSWMKPNE
ncbi:MAG TPA: flagellar basal-body MS-ring/collar protein FliF [Casimicrobiaceae bacterium]|nr:flagellar basal-body MS-ring/collar protein FliF [Casimicrobiaceae bacterium]